MKWLQKNTVSTYALYGNTACKLHRTRKKKERTMEIYNLRTSFHTSCLVVERGLCTSQRYEMLHNALHCLERQK